MPIPLVVTKRHQETPRDTKGHVGQRVESGRQPAARTDRDPNRDKILAWSHHPTTSETYPRLHDNVFGYELEVIYCTDRSAVKSSESELQATEERLPDVLPVYQWHQK